jgi:hypothetical protein
MYPAEAFPPSAYWMALPDGSRTRARVYEQDKDDETAFVIDAVAEPVALLPEVRVQPQPEVIREHRMPVPLTEQFQAWLAAAMLIPARGEPLWSACDRLAAWEALTVRMTSGWPPDGWYPAEYYQEDLANRDLLARDADRLPAEAAGRFTDVVGRVDDAFRGATREMAAQRQQDGWWWNRLPDPVPWPDAP